MQTEETKKELTNLEKKIQRQRRTIATHKQVLANVKKALKEADKIVDKE